MRGRAAAACAATVLLLARGAAAADEPPTWSGSLTATQYWMPHEPDFFIGQGIARRRALHLEGRWQYEELRSFSAFAGWTWSTGSELSLSVTPLAGFVVGRANGLVPGLEADLSWRFLTLYTEDELVVALDDSTETWFYAWTELTAAPTEFLTVGLAAQRTRVVHTSLDLQRGLLARLTFGALTLSVSVFNPGTSDWYVSTGLGLAR